MLDSAAFIHLLRKMAHDMRVPLNTVISTTDMLVQGTYEPLSPKQAKATTRLQRNNHRLLAILDDFVTYIRADGHDLAVGRKPFDPRQQVDEWCRPMRLMCEEKGIALKLTTSATLPATLLGDEVLLKRMVQALVWNAVAYTTQGEIQVTSGSQEEKWCLSVKDTGAGISESDLPHIFEPFWRGEERPQLPTAGAGLGLPMTLALAQLMGGNLALLHTSPQGSEFGLQLPLESAPDSAPV